MSRYLHFGLKFISRLLFVEIGELTIVVIYRIFGYDSLTFQSTFQMIRQLRNVEMYEW